MALTDFALKNTRLVFFIFLTLVLAGILLYPKFPSQEEPTLPINQAMIAAYHPGLDIYKTEEQVARPIERALRELSETKHVETSVRAGEVLVTLEIEDGTPDYAHSWLRVRAKMNDVQPSLPQGTLGPYVDDEYGAVAVKTLALTTTGQSLQALRDKSVSLRQHLYEYPGMDKVSIHGDIQEQVNVTLKPQVVSEYGISFADVAAQLSKKNNDTGLGRLKFQERESLVITDSGLKNLDDITHTLIRLHDGTLVPLYELAEVKRDIVDPLHSVAQLNGNQAVVLAAYMRQGLNMIEFTKGLNKHISQWEEHLPDNFLLEVVTDQGKVVDRVISNMFSTLLQTIVVVIVVTMVALGFRAGSIVGVAVPVTGLITLVILRVIGMELSEVSIASFIIALGILVNNPMVIVEDIVRRVQSDEQPESAASRAGKTLATPILISTLTVILAFAPPMFTDNITAIYMQTLSIVIGVMLLTSWFVATMLMPVLAKWFVSKKQQRAVNPVVKNLTAKISYVWDLVIARPKVWLAGSVLALLLAMIAATTISEAFLPASDRTQLQVSVELSAGTPADTTSEITQQMTRWLGESNDVPQIVSALGYVNDGGPRFILGLNPPLPAPHKAYIVVNLADGSNVHEVTNTLRKIMPEKFPFARLQINPFFLGQATPGEAVIRVSGAANENLLEAAKNIQKSISQISGTANVRDDWEQGVAHIAVRVRNTEAAKAGLSRDDILQAIHSFEPGITAASLWESEHYIPVVSSMRTDRLSSHSDLGNLSIYSTTLNEHVFLSDVVDIEVLNHPSVIHKRNFDPTVTVFATRSGSTAQELIDEIAQDLVNVKSEHGVTVEFGGDIEDNREAATAVFAFLPLCLLIMVALFIYQYNSLRKVLIIVLSIPFCAIGLVLALAVFRVPFDFMANLAIFALIGTVVANAMLILEQTAVEKSSGLSGVLALKAALVARLRPIILTQITTILGLLPLLIANDPLWRSFNLVIMGGLISGTLASFIVVPSLYVLFFERDSLKKHKEPTHA